MPIDPPLFPDAPTNLAPSWCPVQYDQNVPKSQTDTAPQVLELSALDLDMAPDDPGIYAWYARLTLADDDWKPQVNGGVDLATRYLTNAVSDYARVHQPNPLHVRGTGTYRLNWSGTLRRDSIADSITDNEGTVVDNKLDGLAAQHDLRRLLITLLRAATPVFASPLYIGVSTNLRLRLAAHRADYENARAQIRLDPSIATKMQFEGDSFGSRLAATGLQLEHLQCWILPANLTLADTSGDSDAINSPRVVAETTEWILQRIFLPVLGRQ